MNYWTIDKETREIIAVGNACKWNVPRNAIFVEPLPEKEGFAVVATKDLQGTEYIEDYRGITIYDESDCTKPEVVSELGPIKQGFTVDKPLTEFDEHVEDTWVTNQSNKYVAEYNQTDEIRRQLYSRMCDPLIAEAQIKRLSGNKAEADISEAQALAARAKIQTEHPWPTPPAN
ncbi:hypothetical protein [Vibrio lentus]|uniref:hypothetical protein n=1 Tax=Vibrio lentus TaxID=136468 RepID=UPI003D0FB4DD